MNGLQRRRNQRTYTLQCVGKYLEGCIFVIVAEQWIEDYVLKPNDRTRSLPLNINTPFLLKGLYKSMNIGDHVFVLGCFYDISIEF
jgi:hypothetical protein